MTGEAQSEVATGRRTVVLVIGMHRSGTSTVAGALGVLGATMPATGLGLSDDNPKGHFEPKEIVALHDRVLASAGMHWWDWAAFPDTWYDSPAAQPFVDELVDIVRTEFGDAPLFVVKDPRTCQLVALWRRLAAVLDLEVVAVLPFRHPDEVARSLHARDGFPLPNSQMAWLRYMLEAERGSRGLRRIVVRYEDLLADERTEMRRIVDALKLPLPHLAEADFAALEAFVDPALRRSRADSDSLEHLHEWLRDTVAAYARGTAHPHNAPGNAPAQAPDETAHPPHGTGPGPDSDTLDRIRVAFGTACGAFIPALAATNRGFEDAQAQNYRIPGLVAEIAAAQQELVGTREVMRQSDARIAALEAELEQARQKTTAPLEWLRRRWIDRS